MSMLKKVEISHRTVIFTVLFLLSLWLVYFIKDIIFTLFVSFLLMTILEPFVLRLTGFKIPRIVSILITYIILIGVIVAAFVGIVPPLVSQTTNFVNNLPLLLENPTISSIVNTQTINQFISQLALIPAQVLKIGVSIFSNFLALVSILIFTFYMLLYREKINEQVASLFGEKGRRFLIRIIYKIEARVGGWARGQLIDMVALGAIVYLGLLIIRLPYALPLAIFTGLLEIVPTIGIIVAAVPIVIIGLSISPVMGLASVALVLIINAVEAYVLVPKVMEKSAGVNPLVTLIALAVGFRLAGVMGAIVSVPVVQMAQILIKEYFRSK